MADEQIATMKSKHGSILTVVVVLVVLILVIYAVVRSSDSAKAPNGTVPTASDMPQDNSAPTLSQTDVPTPQTSASTGTSETIKTFMVAGGGFYFNPKEIQVNRGDTVKIIFQNEKGFHDWVLDEFNVRTPQIQAGQTAEVTFVADKAGTFEYYCSVGTHRAMGMKGNLIVR